MADVPSNLIPTRISQLPTAPVASEDSTMMIVYEGVTYQIRVGDLHIDFDYSQLGLPDGFDPWRIFVYIMAGHSRNRTSEEETSECVDIWFDDLIQNGQVQKLDNLYYLTNERLTGAG